MKAQSQLRYFNIACLIVLSFMAGETRASMDAWRARKSRHKSLECCAHIEDVRVAASVNVSELRGKGADPEGVSAPSPSGACRMHIHVRRARLSAMYSNSRNGGVGAGLLVDLDVQVKGPSPRCDGSFAHLKVWDASKGITYRSAFSYWGGWLNITSVEHAASAPPDRGGGKRGCEGKGERLRQHTIVLPAEGSYWLEVMYDSEGYMGFLDKQEGLKLSPEMVNQIESVRTVIDPWLDAPASCFSKAIPDSSPGCDCNDARQHHLHQSWPGYWAKDRTEYVPLFHKRLNRWAPGPDGEQSPAAHTLLRRIPGGLLISGTSRQRGLYHDIVRILGFRRLFGGADEAEEAHQIPPFDLIEQRPETRVKFSWTCKEGRGHVINQTEYMKHWLAQLDRSNFCTATSRRGFVIFSDGAHFVANVAGPYGLAGVAVIVNDTLTMLARRCRGTKTVLMVASEMAAHDHWGAEEVDNVFRDNRIHGLNAAVQDMANVLELPFLDVYSMSLSAGRSFNHRGSNLHHYHAGHLVGDIVSMTAASAFLDAVANTLDSTPAPETCAIEIVEPMDGHGIVLGAAETRLWRNVSIIVAATHECKWATMRVSVSVDGRLLGGKDMTSDSAGGSIAAMTVKLGEGEHVILAASDGPDGPLQEVSKFKVLPFTWTRSLRASDIDMDSDDQDRNSDVDHGAPHEGTGRSIAVVACPPPLQHTDCILYAGRVMKDTTGYDLVVLRNDCVEGFDLESGMTQWRLRELRAGHDDYVALSCAEQTWDSNAWWLPPNTPDDFAIYPSSLNPFEGENSGKVYESYVFISAQGVADYLNGLASSFSLAATHDIMRRAGAHVAMAKTVSDDASKGGDSSQSHGRLCTRKEGGIGIISLQRDPPILVFTSSTWICIVNQTILQTELAGLRHGIMVHSLSMSCSPGSSLSACSLGQSCIYVDPKPFAGGT